MSRNLCTIMITALLLSACDPQNEPSPDAGKKAETAPAKHEAAVKTGAAGAGAADASAAAPPPAPETLSSCIATCDDPKLLPTDRTTCRLNCETAHGFKPAAPVVAEGGDPVGDAVSCLGRCYTQGGAALGTCTASCKAVAAAAPVAPAPAALDTLSTCLGGCYADKHALPTNRATCELNCAQEARVAGPAQPAAPR
jgi:hypothetical protein